MARKTITDLDCRLQPVVTALKKNPNNQSSTLTTIKQYWGQALYDWFKNIDKALGSDKFFCRLGTVVWQYKSRWILIAIWALNNITTHKLLTACHEVPLDSYHHQTTNDFEKFLDLEGKENISMITASIFLVLHMHIEPTRFLEDDAPNAEFDADRRLCAGFTCLD